MSLLHFNVHAACQCPCDMPISVLLVHDHASCSSPCCMSTFMLDVDVCKHVHVYAARLYLHTACPCCMPMVHGWVSTVHAACPCAACPCCIPMLIVHAVCLYCMFMPPCYISMCPCCMFMMQVHPACPCCLSVLHVHFACPF
jgi:hypothetical protein